MQVEWVPRFSEMQIGRDRFWIVYTFPMVPMMMMMMMMNCYCGMVDRRKAFSLISSRDHCQRSSSSRISDTPRAGFEPAQKLSSGFAEWSFAAVITTTTTLNSESKEFKMLFVRLKKSYRHLHEHHALKNKW